MIFYYVCFVVDVLILSVLMVQGILKRLMNIKFKISTTGLMCWYRAVRHIRPCSSWELKCFKPTA